MEQSWWRAQSARAAAAALLLAALGGAPALAQQTAGSGGYLRIEGLVGLHFGQPFSNASLADGVVEERWEDAGDQGSLAWGGRGEVGWDFAAGGLFVRVGLIATGWVAEQEQAGPIAGAVAFEPQTNDKPVGAFKVCGPPRCDALRQTQSRSFWEVMPALAVGFAGDGEARYWLGLQPFYGELAQDARTQLRPNSLEVTNSIDSRMYGALVTARAEVPLGSSLTLAASLGLGPYGLEADSTSRGTTLGAVIEDSESSVGLRGQLGLGLDVALGAGLSLGLAGRVDYWSDQPAVPGLTGEWGGPACQRLGNGGLVCEPPRAVGGYTLQSDSRIDLFVGLGVSYRF